MVACETTPKKSGSDGLGRLEDILSLMSRGVNGLGKGAYLGQPMRSERAQELQALTLTSPSRTGLMC